MLKDTRENSEQVKQNNREKDIKKERRKVLHLTHHKTKSLYEKKNPFRLQSDVWTKMGENVDRTAKWWKMEQ